MWVRLQGRQVTRCSHAMAEPIDRDSSRDPGPDRPFHRVIPPASYVVAVGVISSWILLAVVHARDRYAVGWAEGTRMALAREARDGVLFPPLHESGFFGGTRYMPLPVLLHTALSLVTNDYLLSGKLIAYAGSALLLTIMVVLMRSLGCPTSLALLLAAGLLTTRVGLQTATTIEGDSFAVAFQLFAVALVVTRQGRAAAALAGLFCALAVFSKLSAVWAPVALFIWLARRDRGRLAPFAAVFGLTMIVAITALMFATHGRVVEDLRLLTFAGVGGPGSFARAPLRVLELLWDTAPAVVVLMPFAVLSTSRSASPGRALLVLCWLVSGVVLAVVMADEGALSNHLLDFVVLTILLVSGSFVPTSAAPDLRVPAVLSVAVLWAVAGSYLVEVRPDVTGALRATVGAGRNSYATALVTSPVRTSGPILSEDPTVPILLGRKPVILDAWMLLRISRSHPAWMASLTDRISAQEFDTIVLVYPATFDGWYREVQLGEPVAEAIKGHYRLAERAGGLYYYVPARLR